MGFELLLMRHGQAEDWAEGGDSARALTPIGEATATCVGDALRTMELSWEAALSSPFRRAIQTLDFVTGQTGFQTDTMLVPGAPPSETVATLMAYGQALVGATPRLLAVGHNPNITNVLGQLVFGNPGVYFSVAPGDVAHLWIDTGRSGPQAAVLGYYPSRRIQLLADR